jgi:hypothetical protein
MLLMTLVVFRAIVGLSLNLVGIDHLIEFFDIASFGIIGMVHFSEPPICGLKAFRAAIRSYLHDLVKIDKRLLISDSQNFPACSPPLRIVLAWGC